MKSNGLPTFAAASILLLLSLLDTPLGWPCALLGLSLVLVGLAQAGCWVYGVWCDAKAGK